MRTDIFFSICQNEVDGVIPSEKQMWRNFFDQVDLADELGFGTAWIAESHLSSEVQKRNPGAVIPQFKGEIGLNTDILQLAHKVFARTKNMNVGSAIRNILCNGGPMAHAEAIRTFLSLHGLEEGEKRVLEIGFASGRFPYSNQPYGIKPRNELERRAWPVLKGLVFQEATEIFLRFLRGDIFASKDVTPKVLRPEMFRTKEDWDQIAGSQAAIEIPSFWVFDDVGVIPFEAPMELLRLTIGAHDAATQALANKFMPVGVFNLSITPSSVIEQTHERMTKDFHPKGGEWERSHMPRTVLIFIDEVRSRAEDAAKKALTAYWQAVEGTLDPAKIEQATSNALIGTPDEIAEQMKKRYHPDDRLMLWFDFNNHDSESVKRSMRLFMEKALPRV
jgi:alkanesulfonate monooxygenase SsuD/methylene tetrahydromethanopterin reductase-like flavin-dependent oxidoreductase (luciferase family)